MPQDTRPNIVLIMADDMPRDSFEFLGGNVVSPTLDKLAEEGVYFRQAHVPTAICAPSRYTLLTGLDPSRASKVQEFAHGQRFWEQFAHGEDAVYVSEMLQEAGYQTGMVGKTHGMAVNNASYAERVESIEELGFDYAASLYSRGTWLYHNQDWITEGATNFIEQSQSQQQPFFLYMATNLLHSPKPDLEIGGLEEEPNWQRNVLTYTPATNEFGETDPNAQINFNQVRASRQALRNQVIDAEKPLDSTAVTWLDDGIDRIFQKLEELNIAENTVVIFLNDNGMDGGKYTPYEAGTNIPMMIYWKGKTELLQNSDAYAQSYDIVPTILELAQASAPAEIELDGQSLVPILDGAENIPDRDYAYTAIGHTRSVTQNGWKYVAFRVPEDVPNPEDTSPLNTSIAEIPNRFLRDFPNYLDNDQLYRLSTDIIDFDDTSSPDYDPHEDVNLADNQQHQNRLIGLQSTLAQHLINLPGSFGEFKFEVSISEVWQIDGNLDLSALYNGIALKDGESLSADEYLVMEYSGERLGEFEFDSDIRDRGYNVDYSSPGQIKLVNQDLDLGRKLVGDGDDNVLDGGTGNDTIFGNGGNDTLSGGAGKDRILGNTGQDRILGGSESDTLRGGNGRDTLIGGNGDDSIYGGSDRDTLRGGNGNDILTGGFGNDLLEGNQGADILVLERNRGRDIIRNFDDGTDRLGISESLTFDDLTIASDGAGTSTIIKDNNIVIATLQGIDSSLITQIDFVEV